MLSVTINTASNILLDILSKYKIEKILDVTYGEGQLWNNIPKDNYNIVSIDKDKNSKAIHKINFADFKTNERFDVILYDPPYNFQKSGFQMNMGAKLVWKDNKTQRVEFTPTEAIENVRNLNKLAFEVLNNDGLIFVKVSDARFKGNIFAHHAIIIQELSNFNLKELIVYVKLNNMVANKEKCAHIIHGYWMIFQKRMIKS
ncbi:MAG: DNA methyltransferase [Candidatus Babeliales bacterium]|jgi:DNA modification methylase